MTSLSATSSNPAQSGDKTKSKSLRKRLGLSKKKDDKRDDQITLEHSINHQEEVIEVSSRGHSSTSASGGGEEDRPSSRSSRKRIEDSSSNNNVSSADGSASEKTSSTKRSSRGSRMAEGVMKRVRSLSRSRSSRNASDTDSSSDSEHHRAQKTIVTVTSCRSDGYYNQKAPGSTSKLPRKAPTNLKLFHELAVGLKDAYAAVGQTPVNPETLEGEMSEKEFLGRTVLWEFIGNIDFLLALVDEVAVDTATRGALKDDTTFKGLRDVIKKCNKVLEDMLVRRERRYTLFFRLPQPTDSRDIDRIKNWNDKVEKAVGAVTQTSAGNQDASDASQGNITESESDASSIASGSTLSSKSSVFSRGRQLLPVAGRVRARRATPTPKLRQRVSMESDDSGNAAEDGFSAATPVTHGNLAALQRSLQRNNSNQGPIPGGLSLQDDAPSSQSQQHLKQELMAAPVQPKDELVDVIRGLRMEKMKNREGSVDCDLTALKPDWRPKADIPSAVPKLPTEYIHRHRLMKQVVSCLLEQSGAGPRDTDDDLSEHNAFVTSITSRHGDKAGNGKTILAVAAIQTVEVRERFSDGIAWIQLGRGPLSERDIRRLYEELYRQLVVKSSDFEFDLDDDDDDENKIDDVPSQGSSFDEQNGQSTVGSGTPKEEARRQRLVALAGTRRRFQGGDIEGIKEELGRLLAKKKILICLDDVWRVEDAKWFLFDNQIMNTSVKSKKKKKSSDVDEYPSRVLMTTRTPSLLGPGLVQEVFVRILSEHEAVKLLLSTAGRRPYGGKNSAVFNQAKLIVKGCGNSPLAVRLAGSMLRHSNRSWNLNSPSWSALIIQCRLNLEEASQLRSFVNAVNRVVDLSFFTVSDVRTRIALRRCFVAFAMAFRDNDWMLSGRGIPQSVVLRFFRSIILSDEACNDVSPSTILTMLENLNLLERARHGVASRAVAAAQKFSVARQETRSNDDSDSDWDDEDEAQVHKAQQSWVMHESLKSVAEEMARRSTPSLSPDPDDFTSFSIKIEEERKIGRESSSLFTAPLRFLAQQLAQGTSPLKKGFQGDEAHGIVVSSLLEVGEAMSNSNSIVDSLRDGQIDVAVIPGGDKMEEYIVTFLPGHLMRCEAYSSAAEILSDPHYIGRRVNSLGIVEATSRQVADLQELRRVVGNATLNVVRSTGSTESKSKIGKSKTGEKKSSDDDDSKVDVNTIVRDGSRIIIDEVYRVANKHEGNPDSLGMCMCLAAVGEGLLKARQPRDAMLRLEEAIGIYKSLLGAFNTNVADALHTAAKALVKLGETRVALLKFAEAARIYEACDATLHYNSIANAQSLASLLVDLGDMEKAQSMFEEVITMRKSVYGENSVPVAKTINAYAILLAKHGRMNLALQNYEAAKATYEAVPPQLIHDPEFDIKCKYDITLINLNIASIRSKKGDLQEAIACYEDGVIGLREYEAALVELHKDPLRSPESAKNTAHKHLVAALGRIGSLKLKIGDNAGALKAYTSLLAEVKEDSPSASQTEKAKAHIKCATIYRQQDNIESHEKSISHLREALNMYTNIFGPEHKDTTAIASSLRQWLVEDTGKNG
ncbi:tetratricopeptide repeat protein [Nitzschia inconspicua]|uniref:Tetratricopeptide repeat protein n=1 Tax=Nitzschia inconspicua TaxID=303405 RepID=A0A9K3LVH1_9STRA|nr:tetratricopeptide repeat protein [Nitzschia inconspicua]